MASAITVHILIFTFFVILYSFWPGGFENSFKRSDGSKRKATWTDCIYFAAATHTTTGFGDTIPDTNISRLVVTIHMMLVFTIVILGVKL